jgi:hypothetical protein
MRSSSLFEKSEFRDSTKPYEAKAARSDCIADQYFLGQAVH